MTTAFDEAFAAGHGLDLKRTLTSSPSQVWRCWTEAELLKQWFCPAPWAVSDAVIEAYPGGRFFTNMHGPGPDGAELSNASEGCILEAIPERLLVFTDALRGGWRPNAEGFMTARITLSPEGSGTLYHAQVLHADAEACARHEAMGFHDGWGAALSQLETLAATL